VPFVILSVQVDITILRQRIARRMQLANDASEADLAVLDKLSAGQEPLAEAERAHTLEVCNDGPAGSLNFEQELSRLLIIKEKTS
jgi:predicted kinase